MEKTAPYSPSPIYAERSSERVRGRDAVAWAEQRGITINDPERTATTVDALIDRFGIDPDALRDGRDKLLMTAIADDLVNKPVGADALASDRTAGMVALGFGRASRLTQGYDRTAYEPGFSEHRTLAAYEKLTNHARSSELARFIEHDDEFIALRGRLGVTPQNRSAFTVKVLDISDDRVAYGWQPDVEWDGHDYDDTAGLHDTRSAQRDALERNRRYLTGERGSQPDDPLAPAWVEHTSDGSKLLCLPLPLAEKIMYPDAGRASGYDREHDYARDKAYLMHEYVHTQKPVLRGPDVGLGIALEELRAEHFSGNRHGYTDIKLYFRAMDVLYEYAPDDSMEADGPFDSEGFELGIARAVGLDGYLDAMTLIPDRYAERPDADAVLKNLHDANGGAEGHFAAMYQRALDRFGAEQTARRIARFVDRTVESSGGERMTADMFDALTSYGMPKGFTDLMAADYVARYA